MPNLHQLVDELRRSVSAQDRIRQRYLAEVRRVTGRNVIAYYSGWIQKGGVAGVEINDDDKNGFMSVIHGMDRALGLDLILHTTGGGTAATESLVDYLRAMFGSDIRVVVPQFALSGGTMIACAAKSIVMGKHSSLGPIDPQFYGIPAHGVVEEFRTAREEIGRNPAAVAVWQPILSKYNPTWIGECEKAMAWAEEMTREWLRNGMFAGEDDADERTEKVIGELTDHGRTKSHDRHLSGNRCRDIGLRVESLEDDDFLQEAVLSFHHSAMLTFSTTTAFKIIENHEGIAFVRASAGAPAGRPMAGRQPPAFPPLPAP